MGKVVINGQCYEWDDEKRRRTMRKHGVDFADLPAALEADAIFEEDIDHSTDEDRWRALTSRRTGRHGNLHMAARFRPPDHGTLRDVD